MWYIYIYLKIRYYYDEKPNRVEPNMTGYVKSTFEKENL